MAVPRPFFNFQGSNPLEENVEKKAMGGGVIWM